MKNTNLKPFMMFGVIIAAILIIGTGFLALMFSGGGDVGSEVAYRGWGPGPWGMGPFMMIFPCLGFIIMPFIMFFFFRTVAGGGGSMSGIGDDEP